MKRNNKKGFTIVELTIVIAVIAILAAVLIPTFSSVVDKANQSADIQLIRQANVVLQAATADGSSLSEKDAIKELENNSIKLDKPSQTDCVFYYLESENRYVIFNTKTKKATYPEDLAQELSKNNWMPTYKLTYDWNLPTEGKTFTNGQYLDTGYKINWDHDFTINMKIENVSASGNQLLLGTLSDKTYAIAFNIGIHGKTVCLWCNGANQIVVGDFVEDGKALNVTVTWEKGKNTLSLTLSKDDGTTRSESRTFAKSDTLSGEIDTVRFGTRDHRTSFSYERTVTVSKFAITTKVQFDETLNHPNVTSNLDNFTAPRWENTSKMPAKNTTITAQWSNNNG